MRLPLLLAALLAIGPVHAAETGLSLTLGTTTGDFERRTVQYDCGADAEPISVQYLNAAPNFLAIVPVPGEAEPLVFAAVIAASGARYAAANYVWWERGPDVSLLDATQDGDAAPLLDCSEINNTP